jgi:sulfur carrier protein
MPPVTVTVNGERRVFELEPTVQELLDQLKAPASAVAVEVNRIIVPRRSHSERRLRNGDEIEVVTFVGGG